jgi:putative SbcD/Mre11-related phosphoesterase
MLRKELDVVVVLGNHDTVTKPLTDELGIPSYDSIAEGGFFIVHCHELPAEASAEDAHTIIIGHTHPAIRIDDGVRNERFKCFLVGRYKRKRLVVLPSFSTIVEGSDVLTVASNSPFLSGSESMVYVLADEIRPFGKISDLRRILG